MNFNGSNKFDKHVNIEDCNSLNNKQCKIVSGRNFHVDITEDNVVESENIRFFQLSTYDIDGFHDIRFYLLNGKTSNGVAMYDYTVLDQKQHKLSKKEFKKFKKILEQNKNKLVKYKFYPVYSLEFIPHPTGEEINTARSVLTNYNL